MKKILSLKDDLYKDINFHVMLIIITKVKLFFIRVSEINCQVAVY